MEIGDWEPESPISCKGNNVAFVEGRAPAHVGKELEWDVVRHQIGKGGDLLVPDLLNARDGDVRREAEEVLYKKNYMKTVKPFPRVKSSLRQIRERDVKLALASSGNPDEVEYYTQLLDAGDLLEGSTSKKDAKFSKPSPEIFAAALEQAGSDPKIDRVDDYFSE